MIEQFKSDFFAMLKNSTGYMPWVKNRSYELERLLYGENCRCKMCGGDNRQHRQLVKRVLEEQVCENNLIDLFFKSLIRSEQRFLSRFIPQQSHEERLTGHLISEIGGSIEILKPYFRNESLKRYNQNLEIDFFYFDMSKGGKLEKRTGADLAVTILVDLPDYPKVFKTYILQAKKFNLTSSIDSAQFKTLSEQKNNSWGYLFYDTNLKSLASPFVIHGSYLENDYKNSIENGNMSFTINSLGKPLSAFLCFNLLSDEEIGIKHRNKDDAVYFASNINIQNNKYNVDGFSSIISIGSGNLSYNLNSDNGFSLSIE